MSSNNDDDQEEHSFLKHVTSHLPSDWSDERRDTYLQNILTQWRKRRDHSHEEQQPLTRLIYTHVTLPLDSHHGFVVEYAMDKDRKLDFHVDDSAVTLNLCLGTEFTDGQLYFGGVRCSSHTST
ncbi:unnamed protein product [Adineta steineri]|uniref:Uncharacterized protein n=1 Tax=Adineta steineri TaxID=433720 RepID=A0A814J0S4_9BILA|nr:unnamed protein product [Adineta steineri]